MASDIKKPNYRIRKCSNDHPADHEIFSACNLKNGKKLSRRDFLKTGCTLLTALGTGQALFACGGGGGGGGNDGEEAALFPKEIISEFKFNPSHEQATTYVNTNPSADKLLSRGGYQSPEKIWDLKSESLFLNLPLGAFSEWSPDGRYLARYGYKRLDVCDADSGAILCTIDEGLGDQYGEMRYPSLAWNLLSENMAFAVVYSPPNRTDKLLVYQISSDLLSFSILLSYEVPSQLQGANYRFAWQPSGNLLAFISGLSSIGIWDLESRTVVREITDLVGLKAISWSPDGRKLAILTNENLYTFDLDSESLIWEIKEFSSSGKLCWSPDGNRISVTNWEGVYIYDLINSGLILIPRLDGGTNTIVKWSPDGTRILVGASFGFNSSSFCSPFANVYSAEGQLLYTLEYIIPLEFMAVTWIPGKIITAAGSSVFVWDDNSGRYLYHFKDQLLSDETGRTKCSGVEKWAVCTCDSVCTCESVCNTYVEGCPNHVWVGPCGADYSVL